MGKSKFLTLLFASCTASAVIGVLCGYFVFGTIVVSTAMGTAYDEKAIDMMENDIQAVSAQAANEPDTEEPEHGFVVTSRDGYIVVYSGGELKEVTFTPVFSLPFEEQERLTTGIHVYSEEALFRILEDYGS